MTQIVLDCESNGLLDTATTIWCVCVKEDNLIITFSDEEGSDGRFDLSDLTKYINYNRDKDLEIIGHNIIAYDIPLLEKLLNIDFTGITLIDTLVMSRCLDPDRQGVGKAPHSLESWGVRMGGERKVVQEEWKVFDPNMIVRCKGDVRLTENVYKYLCEKELSAKL